MKVENRMLLIRTPLTLLPAINVLLIDQRIDLFIPEAKAIEIFE